MWMIGRRLRTTSAFCLCRAIPNGANLRLISSHNVPTEKVTRGRKISNGRGHSKSFPSHCFDFNILSKSANDPFRLDSAYEEVGNDATMLMFYVSLSMFGIEMPQNTRLRQEACV